MSAQTFKRQWFFDVPDAAGYDRFSTLNKPSKLTFKRLTDSVLFISEDGDTAGESKSGHIRLASKSEVQGRASSGSWSKAVRPEHLPGVVLDHSSGYTAGTAVSANGLKMTPVDHDSSGRRDYSLQLLVSDSFFQFDSYELKPKGYGSIGNDYFWGTNSSGVVGFYELSTISGADEKVKVAADSTADYLNASFFVRDSGNNIKPKIATGKIWVGDSNGFAGETTTGTAFNKAFGTTAGDVPAIASSGLASNQYVYTDSNGALRTKASIVYADTDGSIAAATHNHTGTYLPIPTGSGTKYLNDAGVYVSLPTAQNDHKVKASSSDGTEGYLDAKINTTFLEIASDKISIKDYGITYEKLDYTVPRYVEVEVSAAEIVALNSSPKTVITCPTIAGYTVAIEVIDFHANLAYASAAYTTNTTLALKTATATDAQMTEANALLSTASRVLKGVVNTSPSTAAATMIVEGQDLTLTVLSGNPSHSGTGGTLKIGIYYKLILTATP